MPYKHRLSVPKALTKSLQSSERRTVPAESVKVIVLSDQHRGISDGADDFRHCKQVYHAALESYFDDGYSLYLLGDVEELWEQKTKAVIETYKDTLELEQRFLVEDRLERFLGNHDEKLLKTKHRKHLFPYIGKLIPRDALVLSLVKDDEPVCDILFVHGNQGVKYTNFIKNMVRYVWAPIQWLTKRPLNKTPSIDDAVLEDHEKAMYDWAVLQDNLTMIAGHTHHPVFMSQTPRGYMKCLIDQGVMGEQLQSAKEVDHWVQSQRPENAKEEKSALPAQQNTSYFNTGCCSYGSGEITGIEIEGTQIRLIKWSTIDGLAKRFVLRSESICNRALSAYLNGFY